jgi:hypothetical protein
MSTARVQQVAVVASGDLLSDAVALKSARRVGIVAPVGLTSGQLFVRGATGVDSAASARAFNRNDGSVFNWACGSAGGYLECTDLIGAASHVRIEIGVAQSGPRSFSVITAR